VDFFFNDCPSSLLKLLTPDLHSIQKFVSGTIFRVEVLGKGGGVWDI